MVDVTSDIKSALETRLAELVIEANALADEAIAIRDAIAALGGDTKVEPDPEPTPEKVLAVAVRVTVRIVVKQSRLSLLPRSAARKLARLVKLPMTFWHSLTRA